MDDGEDDDEDDDDDNNTGCTTVAQFVWASLAIQYAKPPMQAEVVAPAAGTKCCTLAPNQPPLVASSVLAALDVSLPCMRAFPVPHTKRDHHQRWCSDLSDAELAAGSKTYVCLDRLVLVMHRCGANSTAIGELQSLYSHALCKRPVQLVSHSEAGTVFRVLLPVEALCPYYAPLLRKFMSLPGAKFVAAPARFGRKCLLRTIDALLTTMNCSSPTNAEVLELAEAACSPAIACVAKYMETRDAAAYRLATKYSEHHAPTVAALDAVLDVASSKLNIDLRPHQVVASAWMVDMERAGVSLLDAEGFRMPDGRLWVPNKYNMLDGGDYKHLSSFSGARGGLLWQDMGMGKTLEVITTVLLDPPDAGPTLVVVPLTLAQQWIDEVNARVEGGTDALPTVLYHGAKRHAYVPEGLRLARLVITTCETLAADRTAMRREDAARLDTVAWRCPKSKYFVPAKDPKFKYPAPGDVFASVVLPNTYYLYQGGGNYAQYIVEADGLSGHRLFEDSDSDSDCESDGGGGLAAADSDADSDADFHGAGTGAAGAASAATPSVLPRASQLKRPRDAFRDERREHVRRRAKLRKIVQRRLPEPVYSYAMYNVVGREQVCVAPHEPGQGLVCSVCGHCGRAEAQKVLDALRGPAPLETIPWYRIVIDEAHRAPLEPNTSAGTSLLSLSAERRWCMTGTPLAKGLTSLKAQLRFLRLTMPDTSKTAWLHLLRGVMLRHTKANAVGALVLPPLSHHVVRLPVSPEDRTLLAQLHGTAVARFQTWTATNAPGGKASALAAMEVYRATIREARACSSCFADEGDRDAKQRTQHKKRPTGPRGGLPRIAAAAIDPTGECPVCLMPIPHAVVLPCMHCLCHVCAGVLLDAGEARCPLCFGRVPSKAHRDLQDTCEVISAALTPDDAAARDADGDGSDAEAFAAVPPARKYCGAAKVQFVVDLFSASAASDAASVGPPHVLVFSQYDDAVQVVHAALVKAGVPTFVLQGSMTRAARVKAVAGFAAETGPAAMVLSTRVAGVGLNLTHGWVVVFMDVPLYRAVSAQVVGRVHRMGQTKPVSVYQLVADGTIEDRMLDTVAPWDVAVAAETSAGAGAAAAAAASLTTPVVAVTKRKTAQSVFTPQYFGALLGVNGPQPV